MRAPAMNREAGYVETNGIRLFYVRSGVGPLVLLCHGFPEFWYSWRAQLAELGDRWQLVALDLRGYHRSDKPSDGYDLVTLAADLAGVVRAWQAPDAVIVGHDLGGMLAWQFALRYPRLTRGVVSLATPYVPRPAVRYSRFFLLDPVTRYIAALQRPGAAADVIGPDIAGFVARTMRGLARNRDAFPPEVLSRYQRALTPRGALAAALGCYRSLDRTWELTAADEKRQVHAPALMLAADADRLFPAERSASVARFVPQVERHVIRDCGHWMQQERPDAVNTHLAAFLEKVAPA